MITPLLISYQFLSPVGWTEIPLCIASDTAEVNSFMHFCLDHNLLPLDQNAHSNTCLSAHFLEPEELNKSPYPTVEEYCNLLQMKQ